MDPILEKVLFMLDEVKAKLGNTKTGILVGEAKERTLARVDELLELIQGR